MTQPSNPPAFPIPNVTDVDGYVFAPEAQGMSLRDWFAGQALVGLTQADPWVGDRSKAQAAYDQADAMLAERERRP